MSANSFANEHKICNSSMYDGSDDMVYTEPMIMDYVGYPTSCKFSTIDGTRNQNPGSIV